MVERSVDVSLQVDSTQIGSGSIVYIDDAAPSFAELRVDRCVPQKLCFNSTCIDGAVEFCYTDTIASGVGGIQTTTLSGDVVYKETGEVIGGFTIPFTDMYSTVTPMHQLLLLLILLLIPFIIVVAVASLLREARR